jgi:hypothetical protein
LFVGVREQKRERVFTDFSICLACLLYKENTSDGGTKRKGGGVREGMGSRGLSFFI